MIEYDHQMIRTPRTEFRAPSVIRLQHHDPAAAAAGQAVPSRGLRPRPAHLPVLRPPDARPDPRPRRCPVTAAGRTRWENLVTACKSCNHRKGGKTLEEARLRLHRDAVRAAQRHLLAVHAVPRRRAQRGVAHVPVPGAELTLDRRGAVDPVDLRPAIPAAGPATARTLWDAGHAAYVVGGSLRDVAARPTARGLGPRARPRCPSRRSSCSRVRSTRTQFGTVAVRPTTGRRRRRDHDLPVRPRLRRLPPAAPGRVRRRRIELDLARRDFTVNAMAWGAEPGATRPALVDPHGGRADIAAGSLRAVGDPVDALRGGRPPDGPRRPAGRDARVRRSSRRRWPAIEATRRARAAPVGRADRDRARQAAGAPTALDRAAAAGRHGPAGDDLAGARGPAGRAPEQGPGRGPLGPHAARGRWRRRSSPLRSASPPSSTTSASRATHGRRPLPRPRDGRGGARRTTSWTAALAGGGARPRSSTWSATTCSATCRRGPTPRSDGSSSRSAATRSTTCSCCARPTTSARACRAEAGRLDELRARIAAPVRGGGRARPARAGDRRHGPHGRARARAGADPVVGHPGRCCSSA